MPVHDADIVVVGAGPAGSAAAIAAARSGRSVMLLDRADFPRDKPCGDLIGVRALRAARALGIAEDDLVPFGRLAGALLTTDDGDLLLTPRSRIGRSALRDSDARVVPRTVFDTAILRAARQAGAEFRTVNVRSVEQWDGEGRIVRGRSADRAPLELRANVVIIAGGYGCRIARDTAANHIPPSFKRPRGIAMRGYFANVAATADRIVFCLNDWVLPGYGWVFPLPDGTANIGIGTLVRESPNGTEHLHDLYHRFTEHPASPIARWLSGASAVGKPRTWPLDLGPRPRRLIADGLLVAGESAALVGPMTGAGIAFALESGACAGEAAANALERGSPTRDVLVPYARWVRRHHLTWLRLESAGHWLVSDPARLQLLLAGVRRLPMTPALGARLLLHLG